MKRENRTIGIVLLAIAVLLVVDVVDEPSARVHLALEAGAAFIATVAFFWLWAGHIRRVFT